jgi:hypothetical protein
MHWKDTPIGVPVASRRPFSTPRIMTRRVLLDRRRAEEQDAAAYRRHCALDVAYGRTLRPSSRPPSRLPRPDREPGAGLPRPGKVTARAYPSIVTRIADGDGHPSVLGGNPPNPTATGSRQNLTCDSRT